jgi:hypothetical protein
MAVVAWMESQEVGRLKLCVEPLKLARLAGAAGSLLAPIVELILEAEKAMMQQRRPGVPALADATVSEGQQAKAAP